MSKPETKTILITGGAGFIGCALAKELLRRGNVRIVLADNFGRGRRDEQLDEVVSDPSVELREADLTDPAQVAELPADIDYVYHLAALVGVKHVINRPDQVFRVNLLSTLNLFDHLRERAGSLKRVLFSSTSEVYAGTLKAYGMEVPTPESTPLTLDDLDNPRTSYALSKITGEAIALQYGRAHGIPVTNVRYHNVYGPRMGFVHVVPETIRKIMDSPRVPVASPAHTRAFCYIDDAVGATIACAESRETAGHAVNIGNPDQELSIRDLVLSVAAALKRSIEIEELPDTPGSPARRCPDITKCVELAGFRPQVDLATGLARTCEWYVPRLEHAFE